MKRARLLALALGPLAVPLTLLALLAALRLAALAN